MQATAEIPQLNRVGVLGEANTGDPLIVICDNLYESVALRNRRLRIQQGAAKKGGVPAKSNRGQLGPHGKAFTRDHMTTEAVALGVDHLVPPRRAAREFLAFRNQSQ